MHGEASIAAAQLGWCCRDGRFASNGLNSFPLATAYRCALPLRLANYSLQLTCSFLGSRGMVLIRVRDYGSIARGMVRTQLSSRTLRGTKCIARTLTDKEVIYEN